MREQTIQNRARLALSSEKLGVYWRANVGKSWTSNEPYKITSAVQASNFRLQVGDMVLRNPRPFDTGLPKGFTDLFGVTFITITPDMVGKRIGVYTGLEAKTANGRLSEFQGYHHDIIRNAGGIVGVFRSPEQAVEIVRAGVLS